MKKSVLILTLFVILAISISTYAWEIASNTYDNMLSNADIEYAVGQGEAQYEMRNVISSGEFLGYHLNHFLKLEYGLYHGGEMLAQAELWPEGESAVYNFGIKHNFLKQDDWNISGGLNYSHREDRWLSEPVNNLEIRVYADKEIDTRLSLYNRLKFILNDDDNNGIELKSGIEYKYDSRNAIRVVLNSDTKDNLSSLNNDINVGFRSYVNEQITYTGVINSNLSSDYNNMSLNNTVEYQIEPGFIITGNLKFNTSRHQRNELYGKLERQFDGDITFIGQYHNTIGSDSHHFLAKLENELDDRLTVYGEYYNNLQFDNNYNVKLGVTYTFN
ncbi:hypothetical protein [Natronospora cellulosivora (SeqCode)]